MNVGSQRHAPAILPPGKTRYPVYRRLGGPQRQSGQVRIIWPLPEFDPRTVQHGVSRYTVYAIPPPFGAERPIYGSYRTANLQTLHFKYLFNKHPY
jgi:hypothetical protein